MKEYRINKKNLGISIFGSLIFVILGILMVTGVIGPAEGAAEIDRIGGIVIGWLSILFFGGIMLIALRFSFANDDEPIIRMDETGFYDRRVCTKPIPWSEIRSATIFRGKTLYAYTQRFISLDVENPDVYLKKGLGHYFSSLFKLLKLLYDEPGITISTSLLETSPEKILETIKNESKGVVDIKL
jgi:hypothetical protein